MQRAFAFLLPLFLLQYTAFSSKWDSKMLFTNLPLNMSMSEMEDRKIISVQEWGCLTQTHLAHHALNKAIGLELNISVQNTREMALQDGCFIQGTTLWVNEHMAVGHLYYDIYGMQVMAMTRVDRIVLQRAPCVNADLCTGIGTWESFYKG